MTTYRSWIGLALALVAYTSLPTGIAQAREGGHFGEEPGRFAEHPAEHWSDHGRDHGDWRGHGVDLDRWHGGRWFHGEHLGRLGWWWIVGDGWYFYPAPVYPYPDPYIPPPAVAPSSNYWYYCTSAHAYYPYVTECPEAWTPVVPQAPQS